MLNKSFITIRIIGVALAAGGIIFLIYRALFNNLLLAYILGITTTIFTIVMAILSITIRQSFQEQVKQRGQTSYKIYPDQPDMIESTLGEVPYLQDQEEFIPGDVSYLEIQEGTPPNPVTGLPRERDSIPNSVTVLQVDQDVILPLDAVPLEDQDTAPNLFAISQGEQVIIPKSNTVSLEDQKTASKSDTLLQREQDATTNLAAPPENHYALDAVSKAKKPKRARKKDRIEIEEERFHRTRISKHKHFP